MANLNTDANIVAEFLVRMNQSSTAAFYTDAITASWFDNANKWAAAYKKWPVTDYMDSSVAYGTSAQNSRGDQYAYPTNFRSGSIRWVKDSNSTASKTMYQKISYKSYEQYLSDFPTGQDQVFSDFGRSFFINPNTATGTLYLFGHIVPQTVTIVDTTTHSLFTSADDEVNEAIVEEMMSYALQREKTPTSFYRGKYISASIAHHTNAEGILDAYWERTKDEQFAYQQKNVEMFKRFSVEKGALRDDLLKRDQFY